MTETMTHTQSIQQAVADKRPMIALEGPLAHQLRLFFNANENASNYPYKVDKIRPHMAAAAISTSFMRPVEAMVSIVRQMSWQTTVHLFLNYTIDCPATSDTVHLHLK